MNAENIIILNRDVSAFLIPSGARIYLQQGTEVTIVQDLGGSLTVNIYGNLARIDEKDADALGRTVQKKFTEADLEDHTIEELVWIQLRSCYDPEIPVNIVELGLIYRCEVKFVTEDNYHIEIDMTLTAPGCGMGPTIAGEVHSKLLEIPFVCTVDVQLVFDPPWDYSRMSEVARLELGLL